MVAPCFLLSLMLILLGNSMSLHCRRRSIGQLPSCWVKIPDSSPSLTSLLPPVWTLAFPHFCCPFWDRLAPPHAICEGKDQRGEGRGNLRQSSPPPPPNLKCVNFLPRDFHISYPHRLKKLILGIFTQGPSLENVINILIIFKTLFLHDWYYKIPTTSLTSLTFPCPLSLQWWHNTWLSTRSIAVP